MPKTKRQVFSIWEILDKPTVYNGEIKRIVRPVINKRAIVLYIVCHLLIAGLVSLVGSYAIYFFAQGNYSTSLSWTNIFIICALICYSLLFLINLRKILISFVLFYQAKAREEIRMKCVFTPSCSEYMIHSLKKHGVIIGLINGLKRLKRCKFPNGGEDYP